VGEILQHHFDLGFIVTATGWHQIVIMEDRVEERAPHGDIERVSPALFLAVALCYV